MRFFLTTWRGSGLGVNEFRPFCADGRYAAIDFRPDPRVLEGLSFFATDGGALRGAYDLGDDANARLPLVVRRRFGNDLKVDLSDLSLRGLIAELLILRGDPKPIGRRTRWGTLGQNHLGRHRIVLLGQVLYDAPIIQGTVVAESFNQADSGTVGPDLTWTEVDGAWSTASSELTLTAVTGEPMRGIRAEHDLDSANHYAEIDVVNIGTHSTNPMRGGPAVRFSGSANTYYGFQYTRIGAGLNPQSKLFKVVAGAVTELTANDNDVAFPYRYRVEIDGSALVGLVDDVEINSTTDADITGHLRTGVGGGRRTSSDQWRLDNFEAGDLVTGTAHTRTIASTVTSTLVDA